LGLSEAGNIVGRDYFCYKRWFLQTLGLSEAGNFMGRLTNISKNLLTQRSAVWAEMSPFFYEFKLGLCKEAKGKVQKAILFHNTCCF